MDGGQFRSTLLENDANPTTCRRSSRSPISGIPFEVLKYCFTFVGIGNFRYIAGTSIVFRNAYRELHQDKYRYTTVQSATMSIPRIELFVEEVERIDQRRIISMSKKCCTSRKLTSFTLAVWERIFWRVAWSNLSLCGRAWVFACSQMAQRTWMSLGYKFV